jgi:hypothetical protein
MFDTISLLEGSVLAFVNNKMGFPRKKKGGASSGKPPRILLDHTI